MLTYEAKRANFSSEMRGKIKILILLSGILFLQSCYTMLNPPQTLPETYNSVTTQVAGSSSMGSSAFTGWDPYWEPVLPFTDYYGGYGASYYNPYNYYDYHHSYYAPVYVKGEQTAPVKGRSYGRDDKQGANRYRESKNNTNSQVGVLGAGGFSTAAPATSAPIAIKPTRPPKKNPSLKNASATRDRKPVVKPVKQVKTKPAKKQEPAKTEQDSKNKRKRTKK